MTPVFVDASVALYCADFRDVLALLPEGGPDLVMADPPYQQTSLEWDRWPDGWPAEIPGRSMWCFGSLRMFMERAPEFEAGGWRMSQDVVWEKHNGSSFHADRFRRVHEQAVHFYRGAWSDIYKDVPRTMDATARTVRRKTRPAHMGRIDAGSYESHDGGPRLMRSVIFERSMHGRAVNETQKPECLVAPLVRYACPPGGLVYSPFAGSGTDLAVARAVGRVGIGSDLRAEQCKKAAERLSQGVLGMECEAAS